MKRTTIFLDREVHEGLRRIAFDKRKTMSDLIREALMSSLAKELESIKSEDKKRKIEEIKEGEIKYRVHLKKTKEGFSVWVPGLPGCWSQGNTEEEALENIKEAIKEWQGAVKDLLKGKKSRFVKVG